MPETRIKLVCSAVQRWAGVKLHHSFRGARSKNDGFRHWFSWFRLQLMGWTNAIIVSQFARSGALGAFCYPISEVGDVHFDEMDFSVFSCLYSIEISSYLKLTLGEFSRSESSSWCVWWFKICVWCFIFIEVRSFSLKYWSVLKEHPFNGMVNKTKVATFFTVVALVIFFIDCSPRGWVCWVS